MPLTLRRLLPALALVVLTPAAYADGLIPVAEKPEQALARYVTKPEPAYGWKLVEKVGAEGVTIYRLELTSQVWQGITWKHVLTVYEPQAVKIQDHAILFVSGGSHGGQPRLEEQLLAVGLANLSGGRVALLKQVPNQPLLGDRVEDDLITETWLQYLKTGDDSWPLLFPMVKSAVKAMDAVGELGKKEGWPEPVEKFVITGASKRGWTSWLTPVAEKRVVATAPMVIDTLNFRAQMNHQLKTWGEFSEQIEDYTRKGLVKAMMSEETPHEAALRTMMDPWTYREQVTIPKLLVHGTNDRYWVVDAAKNYFGDLTGPKYVLQIPNAGHDLKGGHDKVIASIAVLFRRAALGKPLPTVEWKWEPSSGGARLVLESDPPAQSAALWTAKSSNNDFRGSEWSSRPLEGKEGRYEAALGPVKDANDRLAGFAELKFVDRTIEPPVPFSLTTTVNAYLPAQTAASE